MCQVSMSCHHATRSSETFHSEGEPTFDMWVSTLSILYCRIPACHATKGAEAVKELGAAIQPKVQEYIASMEKIKLREGLRLAMLVSADGNKFIQVWPQSHLGSLHCRLKLHYSVELGP